MIEDIEFKVGDEKLVGMLYVASGENNPGLVIIRGGLNIPMKEGDNPTWQAAMAEHGITSLSFDFRGTGDSDGKLEETSLQTRIEDARAAVTALREHASVGDIYLAGVSMGAPIAAKIAGDVGAKGIVMVSPAAYSVEAEDKNFGPAFTEAIRKERNWVDSPDFANLRAYGGKVILAYAKDDKVIPGEILETYSEIVKERGKVLVHEGNHSFLRLEDSESIAARDDVYAAIVEMVE